MEKPRTFSVTSRNRVHRKPARASYDRHVAHSILDEALVVTVAFVDDGQPLAIPMAFARADDRLVLHAASSSRFARVLASRVPLCATVILLDALVLARSAMHHSMNYRSVVVLGVAEELTDPDAKRLALAQLVDRVVAGRSSACRPPNTLELKATRVFTLALEEVSVKCRSGGPIDDADDLDLPYWAGVVPIEHRLGTPLADAAHPPRADVPKALSMLRHGGGVLR
jgi:nitroimidazol reductase NimA-like FMN-containing flavoprotein (pyridoxamine 5'-phosphate oxidase superfamily)